MWNTTGYKRITNDELVTEGKGLLWGFVFDTSVSGDTISIYDGLDASSGKLAFHCMGLTNVPNAVMLPVPVPYENGLYVVLSTNVTDATILFRSLRGNPRVAPSELLETLRALASDGG